MVCIFCLLSFLSLEFFEYLTTYAFFALHLYDQERQDLNLQPLVLKTTAPPLSYFPLYAIFCLRSRALWALSVNYRDKQTLTYPANFCGAAAFSTRGIAEQKKCSSSVATEYMLGIITSYIYLGASIDSHLFPLFNNFSLLYNNSSCVSVANSKLAPSTIASTGQASWQKPQ